MKQLPIAAVAVAGLFAVAFNAHATVFNVDRTIGGGTVTGYITTDDTIGALSSANIIDWAFTLTSPGLNGGSPDSISAGNLQISAGLSATATDLLFDFSLAGFTFFQGGPDDNGWCLAGPAGCGSVGGANGESIFWAPGQTDPAQFVVQTGVVSVGSASAATPCHRHCCCCWPAWGASHC